MDAESVLGRLLPAGSVYAFLAEHRRELFLDAMFADLFPSHLGRPSVPGDVVAAVLVLQALEGRSDREAAEALTFDLRWKAACGLPVGAAGFHPTVLIYWRRRLAASARPNRIFDAVGEVVRATGALTGKTRRALDSTILTDAVATQDTVTQLIAAIRRVRREVPGAAEVVAARCTAHDYDDAGKPAVAWDDPEARAVLVDALVTDAHRLLGHLPDQELEPRGAEAVALLALVAGQDVEPADGSDGTDGRWQIARRVVEDRVISVVDPEARHAHNEAELRQCVRDLEVLQGDLTVTVDGEPVPLTLVESPLLRLDLPEDNLLGVPAQQALSVASGLVALLQPLPPGTHEIVTTGTGTVLGDFTNVTTIVVEPGRWSTHH